MNLRFIDWIWHVRGSLPLAPGQSSDDAFDRLDPLFHVAGTSHERTNERLTFRKKGQAAQDRMSVFDNGVLHCEETATGSVLRYDLDSRALLYCFLAPLLFLAFAQFTVVVKKFEGAQTEAASASAKGSEKLKTPNGGKAGVALNPIDAFLGAPKPEKKDDDKKDKGPSPTPGYVFAGIFAFLYLIGRILEDRLVKSLIRKTVSDSAASDRNSRPASTTAIM